MASCPNPLLEDAPLQPSARSPSSLPVSGLREAVFAAFFTKLSLQRDVSGVPGALSAAFVGQVNNSIIAAQCRANHKPPTSKGFSSWNKNSCRAHGFLKALLEPSNLFFFSNFLAKKKSKWNQFHTLTCKSMEYTNNSIYWVGTKCLSNANTTCPYRNLKRI